LVILLRGVGGSARARVEQAIEEERIPWVTNDDRP
jgi:hypothetical protein